VFQLFETLACYRGDSNQFELPLSTPLLQLPQLCRIGHIQFRGHDNTRLLREFRTVLGKLVFDDFECGDRVAFLGRWM
jgi:hypothetical protein